MNAFEVQQNSNFSHPLVTVVGAGLAGSECAYQLAELGYPVQLIEMRGKKSTPAHKTELFGELVCSNSFGSSVLPSAPSQLKWEAAKLGSLILTLAEKFKVPAGQALAVDRDVFAQAITDAIKRHPRITVLNEEILSLEDLPRPCVIATGPLTGDSLSASIRQHFGDQFLYFFDAIAPVIDADSINPEIAWKADRYGKGDADYWNCPMTKEQYFSFINEVKSARKIVPHHFETTPYFEGCMPIEEMIERGDQTLRFGPLKPVGLTDPKTGREPYAVVQLRQDNLEGTAFNMVGFQTRMAYGEQTRVLKMIPGLESAEFLKLGSIHRNLYINSPRVLSPTLSSLKDSDLYFAGQITGVEGYFDSTCIGLLVARFLDQKLSGKKLVIPPRASAMGSLLNAITHPSRAHNFQPTNINYGLFPVPSPNPKDKSQRKALQIAAAQESFQNWIL